MPGYRRYRNGNASSDDLRQVFEQVGKQPLSEFFAQWLQRPGVPRLESRWRYDASKKVVEMTVTQAQGGNRSGFPSTSASPVPRAIRRSSFV